MFRAALRQIATQPQRHLAATGLLTSLRRIADTSATGDDNAAPSGRRDQRALDAAWDEEAAMVTIVKPPVGVRTGSSTTVIEGVTITDAERREKTRQFLDAITDPRATTRQEAVDMVYAATRTYRTLKEHHLERIVSKAPAHSPHEPQLVRAITLVMAAADAADEAHMGPDESPVTEAVLNALLLRVATAVNAVPRPLRPGSGPSELLALVGAQGAHEPQWWLAARIEARGVLLSNEAALQALEASASRHHRVGNAEPLRANRAEFVDRQRQRNHAAQRRSVTSAEPPPQSRPRNVPTREPDPRRAGSDDP
jgi:hypothetical protein